MRRHWSVLGFTLSASLGWAQAPDYDREMRDLAARPEIQKAFQIVVELEPQTEKDLIELYRTSVDEGGPRPKSEFYSLISSAVQARWHSPGSVDPESTPKDSADYLQDVLEGKALL